MKTLEEILKKNWNANPKNFPFIGIYEGHTEAIMKSMEEYATEAIKADRERIKELFDDCEYADHVIDGILNLPIELK